MPCIKEMMMMMIIIIIIIKILILQCVRLFKKNGSKKNDVTWTLQWVMCVGGGIGLSPPE
jgi:hypothetical protein